MPLTAFACDPVGMGNYCISENPPKHPVRTGSGNNSGELGLAGAQIGEGAGILALMFLTWATRL
jgi:hypothetical protein